MKPFLLTLLFAASLQAAVFDSGVPHVILVPLGVDSPIASTIGSNYYKGQSGTIYKAGYGPFICENSATHTNITAADLPAIAAQLPTLGKSVAISGITDPQAFMAQYGLVRCDKDGNPIQEVE